MTIIYEAKVKPISCETLQLDRSLSWRFHRQTTANYWTTAKAEVQVKHSKPFKNKSMHVVPETAVWCEGPNSACLQNWTGWFTSCSVHGSGWSWTSAWAHTQLTQTGQHRCLHCRLQSNLKFFVVILYSVSLSPSHSGCNCFTFGVAASARLLPGGMLGC